MRDRARSRSRDRPADRHRDARRRIVEVAEGDRYVTTVRFHGTMREAAREAQPFEEAWNLVKPVDGSSGWLLVGIQQYQSAA
jgi:predicted lipid-binding transport protein (Tim44 family)